MNTFAVLYKVECFINNPVNNSYLLSLLEKKKKLSSIYDVILD